MVSKDLTQLKKELKELQKGRKEREQIRRLKFQITSEKIKKSKIVRAVKSSIEFTGELKKANRRVVPKTKDVNKGIQDVINKLPQ